MFLTYIPSFYLSIFLSIYLSVLDVPDVYSLVLVEGDGLSLCHHLHLHRGDVVHRALKHKIMFKIPLADKTVYNKNNYPDEYCVNCLPR